MHWCPGHLFSTHHAHHKNAHTPTLARPCDGAAMPSPCKPLQHILQLEICPRNRQMSQHPMAQPQLRCHTGIICLQHTDISNLKRFEQIELQAKLLNYFLGSNKSNINQTIRLGAGPIQFVYRSHSPLATVEIIFHKTLFPPFSLAFSVYCCFLLVYAASKCALF